MPQSAEKILLVDDEPLLLTALRHHLSDRFPILTAPSAAEALRLLETQPNVAVIVADLHMPGISGIELLAETRRRWPDIRRVMLTGSTNLADAIAAVNEGKVLRFLSKPVSAQELAEALADGVEEYRFATNSRAQMHELKELAASADRARQAFLAMMNHELRTPLNHILGFSALLEQRCKQTGQLDALEYLDYIRESGQALLRTISRIMELARLSAGEPCAPSTAFDLVGMIEAEVGHRRPCAAERQITISFDAPSRPLIVEACEPELAQAVAELLDNAVKFNRPGGHVSVALSWVGEDVAIRIADTGIGMTEEEAERVRSAFRQQDEGLGRRYEGIGLGLTLAAVTAQMNNGSLAIESRKDQGTTVVMRLRRVIVAKPAARIA